MKLGKLKEFCKKHKTKIIFVAGASIGVLSTTAAYLRTKQNVKVSDIVYHEGIDEVLIDAMKHYPDKFALYTGVRDINLPYKLEELGEFGKKIIELKGEHDRSFTHIIAIGPSVIDS